MAYHLTCLHCKKQKWIRNDTYKKLKSKHNAFNVKELNTFYYCRQCRKWYRKVNKVNSINRSKQFDALRVKLQREVDLYQSRGLANMEARNNFLENVKAILDKNYVKRYTFAIQDSELQGIVLHEVIFNGDVMVPLKGKK